MSLLDDLTSKDPQRIWSSACAIRTLRDPEELSLLVEHLDEIERSTRGVPLGGALRANASHLEFAIRKLEYIRNVNRCFCDLYPLTDLYNPREEERAGNITLLDPAADADERSRTYACRCRLCQAGYDVEEEEYHYLWWKWTRVQAQD